MSTDVTLEIDCDDLQQTLQFAGKLGKQLRGGEVIELVSDLGGGKTTFVRGLAEGAGSSDQVSSPTFTLSNVYTTPTLSLNHFDFYRLSEAGIMREELGEILEDEQAVVIVEWASIVASVLPDERITITIQATGETMRHITMQVPARYAYVVTKEAGV